MIGQYTTWVTQSLCFTTAVTASVLRETGKAAHKPGLETLMLVAADFLLYF